MVPGAERKLREHQRLSSEYLVRHTAPPRGLTYEPVVTDRPSKYEAELGPLLKKTPPDVCTTNKCVDFAAAADLNSVGSFSGVIEQNYSSATTLAGQTIPITIKNHNSTAPCKYGTMPHGVNPTIHQGILGVQEMGSSSSNSSSGYCGKSKTLQHQRRDGKKCVKIETFQPEFSGKRSNNTISYSGSAV
ncbi:unnamed protein product [Brassicogethes aeneus]|uniref:Uncharacterized protein n=1 Tax=Brassicogethes aeneus TaxID=1431903 RepID=A0A9P0APJ0_BRAAE|nr:unnamed protein product [Brassicogethes aeneus]